MPPVVPSATSVLALHPADEPVLQALIAEYRRRHLNQPPPLPPDHHDSGPHVAVVLTPPGGIRAMWDSVAPRYTGTGTRYNDLQGTGTGTAVGEEGDRPGYAECEVYVLEYGTPGNPGRVLTNPRMRRTGETLTVYNLSNVDVCGNQFVTIVRDRWGTWWVTWPGFLFQEAPE